MVSSQARYWILTLSCEAHPNQPELGGKCIYLSGQKEKGASGFIHWQFIAAFSRPVRLAAIKNLWPEAHAEPTRSEKAEDYCHKEESAIPDTEFTLGARLLKRNSSTDWDLVKKSAVSGDFASIPSDIFIRYYSSLRRIAADHATPIDMVRTTNIYWGPSGTGKTRLARQLAGEDVYIKNPNTKWWDGYRGQQNVIIDEFRGRIDVSYLLLWLDRYKCSVEIKGSSLPLCAINFWICSNMDPSTWYPELDADSYGALKRRVVITHFNKDFFA